MVTAKENKFLVFLKKFKLPLIIVGAVLVLSLIIFLVIKFFFNQATVSVLVAPESAEILIDGKEYKNGVYSISTGSHFVEISANGFSYTSFSYEVKRGEENELFEYLPEETASYSNRDYDILSLIVDQDDKTMIKRLNARIRAKTIFTRLPYKDEQNRVYLTDQATNKNCKPSKSCIGITNLGDLTEDSAYDVVRKLGYDPNDYTVFYELGTNNYYSEGKN